MFDSVELLIGEVLLRFAGIQREFLEPKDVTAAVFETLAFYGLQSQQSQYTRILSCTTPFVPNARDSALTQIPQTAIPLWLERRISTVVPENYEPIYTVHISVIHDHQLQAIPRCSFYKQKSSAGSIHRLRIDYQPSATPHRVWYYAENEMPGETTEPLNIPARFGYMFTAEAVILTVPKIMMRAANLEDKQLTTNQLQALDAVVASAAQTLEKWEPLWDTEKLANRAPKGRNRKRILGNTRL